jgi:hypothetical protein
LTVKILQRLAEENTIETGSQVKTFSIAGGASVALDDRKRHLFN